ncbi:hypothetical protein ABBQ38_007069 [Trebouxia sp. C0009 RCD-2024]
MVGITVQTASGRRYTLQCRHQQEVAGLKHQIEHATGLPGEKLKLVHKGKTVDQDYVALSESDVVLVMVTRGPTPVHPAHDEDDEDVAVEPEETKVRLPANASNIERKLLLRLRHDWHLPEYVLMVVFAVHLQTWLIFVAWLASIPIAHAMSIGPLYILGSLILVIFRNLGKRQPGEASAYSIFNDFQELPGQLNAGRLDEQLRHGHM